MATLKEMIPPGGPATLPVGLLVLAGLAGLTYWLVDCSQGHDVLTSGRVIDKHHEAEWNEYRTVVVQDGPRSHLKIESTHHPERYVLSVHDGEGSRELTVDRAAWMYYRPGEWIRLRKRYGKRSKCKCFERTM